MKEIPLNAFLPCVGCGHPVGRNEAGTVIDRHGFWHSDCEQRAWEESGCRADNVKAPFENEWRAAKQAMLDAMPDSTSGDSLSL